ncbi:MAG: 30S ribosome-binding factor RbfA [Desulfohalobiaceae bacterium]
MRKATSRRSRRLEEFIMAELGRILIQEVQDPRLDLVTISGIRLNKDLSVAEVLYTHAADQEKRQEVELVLEKAQGYLRSRLGKRLHLRHVPALRFQWDEFLEENIYAGQKRDSQDTSS